MLFCLFIYICMGTIFKYRGLPVKRKLTIAEQKELQKQQEQKNPQEVKEEVQQERPAYQRSKKRRSKKDKS